jgi:hypothetical protein
MFTWCVYAMTSLQRVHLAMPPGRQNDRSTVTKFFVSNCKFAVASFAKVHFVTGIQTHT